MRTRSLFSLEIIRGFSSKGVFCNFSECSSFFSAEIFSEVSNFFSELFSIVSDFCILPSEFFFWEFSSSLNAIFFFGFSICFSFFWLFWLVSMISLFSLVSLFNATEAVFWWLGFFEVAKLLVFEAFIIEAFWL